MSHRTFRLSISPDDSPEVRRVIDFDGRSSLHDVHRVMLETLSIGDGDHLYAFFLSGKYWDKSSEYVDPRTDGPRADQARLFRLRLRAGQHFVYVYDYGAEQRYDLSVVSVTETEAALPSPLLIESVGEAPGPGADVEFDDADDEREPDPEWPEPFRLALVVTEQLAALDDLAEDAASEEVARRLRELGEATLTFVRALEGDLQRLVAVDREFGLLASVLDVPGRLSAAHETDLAVRVAEALKFCAEDEMNGEIALSYARAGERQRALGLVLTNLETAKNPFIAETKAGDVYSALAEDDAAEAYYRRALAIAQTSSERSEATLRMTSFLIDTGREAEATAFVSQQRAAASSARTPAVGRNEPCPCGSGKKYKKCHGA